MALLVTTASLRRRSDSPAGPGADPAIDRLGEQQRPDAELAAGIAASRNGISRRPAV
ncbi:hypothetical protein [Micromonospora sonchi]|uniref:hypothetical protein n=1 Tax=Micromonospora sonchi TaxID=1763543 RepID=UPI001669AE46|nr:hypothetical protein [Micromonospora sonchi]